MRWYDNKINKEQWHIWFAWYPVKIFDYDAERWQYVWLEKVLRMGRSYVGPGGISWVFTYRSRVKNVRL